MSAAVAVPVASKPSGNQANMLSAIKASQKRIEALQTKLAEEFGKHDSLVMEFEGYLAAQLGRNVSISGISSAQPKVPVPDAVVRRIVELRDRNNLSFEEIAAKLNFEGFKPFDGNRKFTQQRVREIWDTRDE